MKLQKHTGARLTEFLSDIHEQYSCKCDNICLRT